MRSLAIGLAAAVMGAVGIGFSAEEKGGAPGTKPATVTVKGEVVDLWCFLDHGARGEKHKECAIACAKAGNPIGLADEKGEAYLLMGAKLHESMRDDFIKQMAATVTVKGRLVQSGGLKAIYVESMEAAK